MKEGFRPLDLSDLNDKHYKPNSTVKELVNLATIKVEWKQTHSSPEYTSLEKFIRANFTPVYDKELNFVGYERGSLFPPFKE